MRSGWNRPQPDLVTRLHRAAIANDGDQILLADASHDLGFGSGRLDHNDVGFDAIVREFQMLRRIP